MVCQCKSDGDSGREWDKLAASVSNKIKLLDLEVRSVNVAGALGRWQYFMSQLDQRYYPSLGWPMPFKMREYVLLYREIESFNREIQEVQSDISQLTNICSKRKQLTDFNLETP